MLDRHTLQDLTSTALDSTKSKIIYNLGMAGDFEVRYNARTGNYWVYGFTTEQKSNTFKRYDDAKAWAVKKANERSHEPQEYKEYQK